MMTKVIVYYRCKARVYDAREFNDWDDFTQWYQFASKWEPIMIIGIYDGWDEPNKTEEDIKRLNGYLKKEIII